MVFLVIGMVSLWLSGVAFAWWLMKRGRTEQTNTEKRQDVTQENKSTSVSGWPAEIIREAVDEATKNLVAELNETKRHTTEIVANKDVVIEELERVEKERDALKSMIQKKDDALNLFAENRCTLCLDGRTTCNCRGGVARASLHSMTDSCQGEV